MFALFTSLLFYVGVTVLGTLFIFLLTLKLCAPLNDYIFTLILAKLGPKVEKYTVPYKKNLFTNLDDVISGDAELAKSGRFRLLEFGVGSGSNFQFYPANCNVITLDPNPCFHGAMDANKKLFKDGVVFEKHIAGKVEDMSSVPSNSVDVILCTYVLCSVNDICQALTEVKRVLCKGGKFIYFEHVSYPRGAFMRIAQQILGPIWKLIFHGCIITRFTFEEIEKFKFNKVSNKRIYLPLEMDMGFLYWITLQFVKAIDFGVATK